MSENNETPDKIENSDTIEESDLEDSDLIDPEVKEEVTGNFPEDPLLTEYATQQQTNNKDEKVDVTSEWIGEKDEWKTKSKLSAKQIIALIQIRILPSAFEELEDNRKLFEEMATNMEKYAISHQGIGREQQVDVLRAMHSGEMGERSEERNMILEAFSAGMNTETEE